MRSVVRLRVSSTMGNEWGFNLQSSSSSNSSSPSIFEGCRGGTRSSCAAREPTSKIEFEDEFEDEDDFGAATSNYDKSGLYSNPGPAFQLYIICSCESGSGCAEPSHSPASR